MANRILTPSNVPNLFGAGKPGFGDDPNPLLATAFDASWCNGVQEELIRIIEYGFANGIGVPPNGAIFDQVLTVLLAFPFNSASIANGGTFTMKTASTLAVETGSVIQLQSGSLLEALSGSTAEVASGATFRALIGSIVNILGDAAIGTTSAQTLTVESTTQHNADVTLAAATDLTLAADGTVTAGTFDTIDATGDVLAGKIQFYTGTPLFGGGVLVWDGHALTLGNGTAAPRIARPVLSYVAGPIATAAAISDTGASVSLTMVIGEKAKIVASASIKSDALGATINFRVEDGVGIIGNADSFNENAAAGAVSQSVIRVIQYTSTVNGLVTFRARHGANGGNNTTSNDVSIEASYI